MNTLPPDDPHPGDWSAQRAALRGLHHDTLDAPLPPALRDAALRLSRRQAQAARQRRWWLRGGMAASLLMAFGAGWLASTQWPGGAQPGATGALARLAPGQPPRAARGFVHDAAVAHAVYAPEKGHPVEVAASEEQHLVQWLSRRLDRPLKVPDLSAQGYALVGGRLLPGGQGARAQFMFEGRAGERVTLYIGALDPARPGPAGANAGETAFRFSADGPVPSFYWVDQGFGYALSGALSREALSALAATVYRQL